MAVKCVTGCIDSVLEAVGWTPMVRMPKVGSDLASPLYAKLEYMNPGGSVKDRVATAMIEEAERQDLIKPGGTIIEATSGNTGVGLAMAAAVKGYRCIFIMPDKMSAEKTLLLRAYGAEVVMTPTAAETNSPEGYNGVAARLLNEIPNSWRPNQFANLINPEFHYKTTGPEIWEQTDGKVTCFVAGIGTGGTISGVGKYLKEQNPAVKIVGADPEGSIISGDKPRPWAVEGIGEDFVPTTLNPQVVDEWVRVSDADSFAVARQMARGEGLLVGGSSGTCVAAAISYAKRLGPDDLVVALCPDTGRNYLSKFLSDEWMAENGYLEPATKARTATDLIARRGKRELISVSPEDDAEAAVGCFRKHGVSQVPVIEDGKLVGCVRELTVARLMQSGRQPCQVSVGEIMARPMPAVDGLTQLDEIYRLLSSGNSGVIVTRGSEILDIITRIDLIEFWDARITD
jgi:cystathionine beta-synthase